MERENKGAIERMTSEVIRSLCGLLKSNDSVTKELLEERARDKKRDEVKFRGLRSSKGNKRGR